MGGKARGRKGKGWGGGREGEERGGKGGRFDPHFSLPSAALPLHTITNRESFHFYRAMHFSAFARSWDRMSSVRPSVCLSVCLSVCDVGDL